MTNNSFSASIHPPSMILTEEVQRQTNSTNERERLTESDNAGDDVRCSNTVTTGGSSSITSSEIHKLESGLSTLSTDESHDISLSGEQPKGLTLAQQAVQHVIDQYTIDKRTSPVEAASALIRARQQLRQNTQQQLRTPPPPPPSTTSHPSDEAGQVIVHHRIITQIPSPTLVTKQQSAKKSILLSHHIDHSHERNVPSSRNGVSTESQRKTSSNVASAASTNYDNDASVKATPDTSRSSSPSVSVDDVNVDFENQNNKNAHAVEENIQRESIDEMDESPILSNNGLKIVENISNINPACQEIIISTKNAILDKQNVLPVTMSTDQGRPDTAGTGTDNNSISCSPESSFDSSRPLTAAMSPILVQKVTAYIDLVTSTSKSQPAEQQNANAEDANDNCRFIPESRNTLRALDEMSIATSQSYDVNIDPKMMNYVTSSVRDYIDSIHTNKTKSYNFDNVEVDDTKINKALEVKTMSHNLHADSLIEYLSAKALVKHDDKDFGADPPSTSDDEMIKNDPPITLTDSEVTRSAAIEPEKNPFKAVLSNGEQNNAITDPEVPKAVIMYDKLGEQRQKSLMLNHVCDSVDNETLICDAKAGSTSYQLQTEKVVDTPKRKTTFITIPVTPTVDNNDEIHTKDTFEPDGLYPSSTTRDFVVYVQNLYYLLTGNDDVTDIDIQQFGKLVQFSSLFIDSNLKITSYGTSQIMSRANELHVSLHISDRYLDAIRTMGDQSKLSYNDLEDLNNINQFLRDLSVYLEILMGKSQQTVVSDVGTDPSLRAVINVEVDAFEVEVNDGYTNIDFRPSEDEEPWWEVVARLNGTSCHDSLSSHYVHNATTGDDKEPLLLSNINDLYLETTSVLKKDESAPQDSVERDIAKFWLEREKAVRHPEVLNLPHVASLIVKKAHSYSHSGQDVTARCRKSKRISKTKSCSSTASNISQRSLKSMRRKWVCQQNMAKSMEDVPKLNAVSATSAFFDKDNKLRIINSFSHVWRLSYAERTQDHDGYFDVDKYSLYAASAVQTHRHPLDCVAWESRLVKQRFMYEQSISFTRNWFGWLTEIIAIPVVTEPVCRPKSMEMPMEADEWTEEWFLNRHRYCQDRDDYNNEYDDDNLTWNDERPECGTIRNVRLRIGEKITRVTPDLTSHVRRSRWRKKHFPPGTFPYT